MPELDEIRQEARRNTRGRFEQWAKNPTCDANTLSAVHNVRLDKAAKAIGLEVGFGQSPFAIARGNRFEAGLFWDDAQKLRAALERKGCLPESSVGFLDLRLKMNGGTRIRSVDHALEETEGWLRRIAPGLRLCLVTRTFGDTESRLVQGTVDFGLGLFSALPASLKREEVASHRYACVFRKGHPVARQQSVSLIRIEPLHKITCSTNVPTPYCRGTFCSRGA